MSHNSPATSMVSLATNEDATVTPSSSTTALVPKAGVSGSNTSTKPTSPPKDYESAFAALSSSYGFSGAVVPSKNPKRQKKDKGDKAKKATSSAPNQPAAGNAPGGQSKQPDFKK